eukprot:SAG11_NODE_7495_length_1137_cov_1.123314_2_plen_201_part_00
MRSHPALNFLTSLSLRPSPRPSPRQWRWPQHLRLHPRQSVQFVLTMSWMWVLCPSAGTGFTLNVGKVTSTARLRMGELSHTYATFVVSLALTDSQKKCTNNTKNKRQTTKTCNNKRDVLAIKCPSCPREVTESEIKEAVKAPVWEKFVGAPHTISLSQPYLSHPIYACMRLSGPAAPAPCPCVRVPVLVSLCLLRLCLIK